jgi:two-component system chemotaxis sensor kinase CheA
MDDFDLSEFKDLFVDESQRHLQTLNTSLLTLEQDPQDAEAINAMFRAAHSIKGSSATMGYDLLATLAHGAEDALYMLREGRWTLTPVLANLLFAAIDTLQALLADVVADREHSIDIAAMLDQLRSYSPEAQMAGAQALTSAIPEKAQKETIPEVPRPDTEEIGPTTMIRVDVRHLDTLLNVVTEMVIHRSFLERLARRYKLPALNEALDVQNRLLTQLRDAVLEMRMVPLSQVFDRFPRMVRDLLRAQGKEARLLIEGTQVEMDRTAVEALGDPLVHLLRNAIDHGLELPAERLAAGKPSSGMLRLAAWRERDTIVIEASDDGQGIDARKVASVAVERGIVTQEAIAAMSREQILELICHPGFSLSKEVTAISGRGVGMNVVKRQVERLRGTLKVSTQPGQGSTFRLQLPVSLALAPAVLVRVGTETYALPMSGVEQIVEVEPEQIEQVGDQRVIALGKTILPLRRLSDLLAAPGADPNPRYAVLVRNNGAQIGLCVDAVEGHEEIVVKPMPEALREIPGLSGVTILGEGQTVLILDEKLPSGAHQFTPSAQV